MSVHSWRFVCSVLLTSLSGGCNSDPLEPSYRPNIDPGRLPGAAPEQNAVPANRVANGGRSVPPPSHLASRHLVH